MPDGLHPLRRWRLNRGFSLAAVAAFTMTTPGTLSRIETGRQFPRPDLLTRLVDLTRGSVGADQFVVAYRSLPS